MRLGISRVVVGLALTGCGAAERVAEPLPALPMETAAAPSAPATSAQKPDPGPNGIDHARASELPQVWRYPTDGGEPLSIAGIIVVKDAEGESLSAVAPATGKPVWTTSENPDELFAVRPSP